MTVDERLNLIRVKVERAKKHIRELEAEIQSFLATKPYAVGAKRDPETKRPIYYVVSVRDTPIKIAVIAGDVIQNLRSALDHLAYQLVIVGTGKTPSAHIYFPIADDAAKYKAQRSGKTKGMRPEAVKAIDALKPYKGGNDTLWLIHKLNNVDKHRVLLTVGSAYHSFNVGTIMQRELQKSFSSVPARLDLFLKPADRKFPLKQGDELFMDLPDAEVNSQVQFVFEVAFGESQIIEGKPLIETLKQMGDFVDNLVLTFKPLLA